MRRLPETDLANTGALAPDERYAALWRVNLNTPKVTYQPTRRHEADIFNARGELLAEAREADFEIIKELIRRDRFTKNEPTERANIEVTECLHNFAVSNRIQARRYPISPFVLSGASGIKLIYWSPLVLVKDRRLHVIFIDPRRRNGLTPEGRRFVFSMMHHRARTVYLDLEKAELAILQFPMTDENQRCLEVHFASELDDPLLDYDDLEQRVRETYDTWRLVLQDRAADLRRKADQGLGGFGLSA
jgi:hypothetical protein